MIQSGTGSGDRQPIGAFSLVEAVVALGIFVFALVAILGMLPMALQTSRESLDISTATRIADGLAADLGRREFSSLAPGAAKEHFFDDQGNELSALADPVYYARVELHESESPNLLRTQITIGRGAASASHRTFPYLLVNNDY